MDRILTISNKNKCYIIDNDVILPSSYAVERNCRTPAPGMRQFLFRDRMSDCHAFCTMACSLSKLMLFVLCCDTTLLTKDIMKAILRLLIFAFLVSPPRSFPFLFIFYTLALSNDLFASPKVIETYQLRGLSLPHPGSDALFLRSKGIRVDRRHLQGGVSHPFRQHVERDT